MIGNHKILALIPARSGSKGLPGKNILPFCGKPLLAWSIESAKKSKYIDEIILSTDSQEYAQIGLAYGATVPFIRPTDLASDTTSSIEVIAHAINEVDSQLDQFSILVMLEPTSPLREEGSIDKAIEDLVSSDALSIVAVAKSVSSHPEFLYSLTTNNLLSPFLEKGKGVFTAPRRQNISDLFYLSGNFYIGYIPQLLKLKSFYHDRCKASIVTDNYAFEIDSQVDFVIAEALMKFNLSF